MRPPPDYLNLLYALENNMQTIHFSPSLDPIITPIMSTETFNHNVVSYMEFFETADPSRSTEPLVVEYYKLKFKLKSFEEIVGELEEEGVPELEFFPLQINDFLTNGTTSDLYVAPFKVGELLESDMEEEALRFFEEGYRMAVRWRNQEGVDLCMNKIERLREYASFSTETDLENKE